MVQPLSEKHLSDLYAIVSSFHVEGPFKEITRLGSGHINDTYLVSAEPPQQSVVLQRINHQIFKNVAGLMNNVELVCKHINKKVQEEDNLTAGWQALEVIKTRSGSTYHHDETGNFWRLYTYIDDSFSFDQIHELSLAREGGRAFARFQIMTNDVKMELLVDTIPHFHDLNKRYQSFLKSVEHDPVKRVQEIPKEIAFVHQRIQELSALFDMIQEGEIPIRVTHNDTKFNNILFNRLNQAISIVDLDTVMPGSILFDFGDAIRTGANSGAEDEANLSKVELNLDLFRAYTEGYLSIAKHFLTANEVDNLALSAKYMTFIIGLRFLTDYVDGDHYYRIHTPHHNLQRARVQFKLVESIEENFDAMQQIIASVVQGK